MGTAKTPAAVKLVAGLLATSDALLAEAARALSQRFGPIDLSVAATDWTATTYYRAEMGTAIRRQFLGFERLMAPGKLAAVKQMTNEMEAAWSSTTGRQVNIDPGYIATTKLVLASTKDAAHRIYLSGGIYAEVTLRFLHGSFGPCAFTYPDYTTAAALQFFNRVREVYLAQLRASAGAPGSSH